LLEQAVNIWHWHPPVGVWIGILGLLGVLVPLFRDLPKIGKSEKAFWTFVMFALLLLEIKSAYQDRAEHDEEQANARTEQLNQFSKIAEGIKTTTTINQEHFDATMGSIKSLLETTNAAKKNTEPKAYVKLSAFSIRPSSLPMVSGHQLQFNVVVENGGSENATEIVSDAKVYLGKLGDLKAEQALDREFEKWWERPVKHPHWARQVLSPGEKGFFTIDAPSLTDEDLRQIKNNPITSPSSSADDPIQIQSHVLTFYIFARSVYSDHTGRWVHDRCLWIQNPVHDLRVTRPCSINDNPKHSAKRPWSLEWNSKLR
jgi:hypothetical protein